MVHVNTFPVSGPPYLCGSPQHNTHSAGSTHTSCSKHVVSVWYIPMTDFI